ncbi:hypothetical protein CL6EHI_136840 [Entamoeba histolytica]|uniref:Uncharacterized protein n=2 Tax=Entamoeba histolytica TaxID=5759 RepID=B1N5X5_ENTH1|nr:hypothetical protein EHI_136840 [Entamoeba histolytica HM-1:IMSS]EDS88633.1 hypothetical protein EHI_136840 [Entamoeba histolytica HM-1:IMSS]GAT99678.1 hypothetical protein CL6EHI_136840 [Entamoeba histolytica]|eukprot:XP_001914591.1 hypothetical protein EHI_136840 [Entamoeba histolytica HM-1:IMSS]
MNSKPIRAPTNESNTIRRKPTRSIRSSQSMVSDTDSSESIAMDDSYDSYEYPHSQQLSFHSDNTNINLSSQSKIRNYIKLFMKSSSNLSSAPRFLNLVYVSIPNSVTDYKHGNMYEAIKQEVKKYIDDNETRIKALLAALASFKVIKASIEPSIITINRVIISKLSQFNSSQLFNGNGLFYLIENDSSLNTIDLLVSNIIITLQRRIIIQKGKSSSEKNQFNVADFYGSVGKTVKKEYTVGLKDSINDLNALGRTKRGKTTKQSSHNEPNAFNLHSFILVYTSLSSLNNYSFFDGKINAIAIVHLINGKVIPNCLGNIWVYVRDWSEEDGRCGKFNVGKQNVTWCGGKYHPDPLHDDTSKYLKITL